MNTRLMLIVAVIVGIVIYMEINKQIPHLNEKELNPDMSKYIRFCDHIDDEIDATRKGVLFGDIKLIDSQKKDEFLEKLSLLRKELAFLQTSHQTNKNSKIWEEKLFDFLSKFENIISEFIEDAQSINDKIREKLQAKMGS